MRIKEGNKEKDILEAAIKVFAEFGYHRSKIAKIAEVANVATGSVYVYYKNKEDILQKIFETVWRRLYLDSVDMYKNQSLSPIEKLDGIIDMIFDLFSANSSLALVFVNEQNHLQHTSSGSFTEYYEKFFEQGELIVKEGINENVFTGTINVKIFRQYIFGGIRHLLNNWAYQPELYPINRIRQNVKYFIKNGIKS
jgi:TetR/AcrR family fatty acid metabolism transcriptional regulator